MLAAVHRRVEPDAAKCGHFTGVREGHVLLLLPFIRPRSDQRRRLSPQDRSHNKCEFRDRRHPGHGNSAQAPRKIEANAAALAANHGGVIFTEAEIARVSNVSGSMSFEFRRSQPQLSPERSEGSRGWKCAPCESRSFRSTSERVLRSRKRRHNESLSS